MEVGIGSGSAAFNNIEQNVAVNRGEIKREVYERVNSLVEQKFNLNDFSTKEKAFIGTIEKANKKIMGDNKELSFSIHEKTKQIMVKIVDKQSKEVIKEIPPEKILDMVAQMCENAGLFIDEKK